MWITTAAYAQCYVAGSAAATKKVIKHLILKCKNPELNFQYLKKTKTDSSFLLQKKPSCISSGLTTECSFFSPFCFA